MPDFTDGKGNVKIALDRCRIFCDCYAGQGFGNLNH